MGNQNFLAIVLGLRGRRREKFEVSIGGLEKGATDEYLKEVYSVVNALMKKKVVLLQVKTVVPFSWAVYARRGLQKLLFPTSITYAHYENYRRMIRIFLCVSTII
ncbi:hypothetical protein MKW98_026029 [Papaver atlanticum]|uniref:Uncharacterized protein n=1 Tax=Papaver atlanticum TaxID=357466 RepID=A0AAD4RXX8_9MAGN|nr:hypothetical protein MKW98_026029 [Papaver atlanticum]